MHLVPVKALISSLLWKYFFPHPLKKKSLNFVRSVTSGVFLQNAFNFSIHVHTTMTFPGSICHVLIRNDDHQCHKWTVYEHMAYMWMSGVWHTFLFYCSIIELIILHHKDCLCLKNDGNRKKTDLIRYSYTKGRYMSRIFVKFCLWIKNSKSKDGNFVIFLKKIKELDI